MKKLLLLIAIISLLPIACGGNANNEKVKKMPSKIGDRYFQYDVQNHIVKIDETIGLPQELTYNKDNTPSKIKTLGSTKTLMEQEFVYKKNQIFIIQRNFVDSNVDTVVLTLDDKGNLLSQKMGNSIQNYSYNPNGNIIKILSNKKDEIHMTYSTVKSIFRHVNATDWFLIYKFHGMYNKDGYMLSLIKGEGMNVNFTYELDTDHYVKVINNSEGYLSKSLVVEYVLAN